MSLQIEEKDKGGVVLLDLKGSLDAGSIEELDGKVKELEDKQQVKVVLRMDGLEFISSAGWSIFIELSKDLRALNGDLRLAQMPKTADRIFDLMGLNAWLKSYPSAEEAVSSYAE